MGVLDQVWMLPPRDLALLQHEVHVWRASLDQPSSYVQYLMQTLSPDEQLRARRMHFERDRTRFVVGRGLLRNILGHYVNVEPHRVGFRYEAAGKPALAAEVDTEGLQFNLSHSHDLVLYAVTRDQKIGIDLERVRPLVEAERTAAQIFSPHEHTVFRSLAPHQQHNVFFHGWTRKEAYTKACGDGLARPLDRIEVSLVPWEPARFLRIDGDPQEARRWSLLELRPAADYVGALAVEGTSWTLKCWQWSDFRGV